MLDLVGRAREIHLDVRAADRHAHVDVERVIEAVGGEGVGIGAVGDRLDRPAQARLRTVEDIVGEGFQVRQVLVVEQAKEAGGAGMVGGKARSDVAERFLGLAQVGLQDVDEEGVLLPRDQDL